MTCCNCVLYVVVTTAQTAEKVQFVTFGFQVAIMSEENKMKALMGEVAFEGDIVIRLQSTSFGLFLWTEEKWTMQVVGQHQLVR